MEKITSRKNKIITHIKKLSTDSAYRCESKEYVCDGEKLLNEAVSSGVDISCVLWAESAVGLSGALQFCAPADLISYVSPLKNSTGPVFTVKIPKDDELFDIKSAIILDGVQDPGNVGTIIRSAGAFDIDAVILTGDCSDLYNPKTVRSTMGAVFRQKVIEMNLEQLQALLLENNLPLYGAALTENAVELGSLDLKNCAVAIGSEGSGLSRELLDICEKQIIIPMDKLCESLNASIAASIIMWEMSKS